MHAAVADRPVDARSARGPIVLWLMIASGCAGLGYQIVWTQQSALWLGHENAGVLAVVAAFFAGLGVGAWALARVIDRSRRPAAWYAGCEALIGLWSLVLAFLMAPVSERLLDLTGAQPTPAWQWLVAFGGTFLLLLPATAAMGATLPAMERVLARVERRGPSIALLYAGNTFGAVVGVVAATFWLVPEFGLARTAVACATLNAICAVVAWIWLRAADEPDVPAVALDPERRTIFVLAATGALGIGYEVLVVRVLSQVAENTVYTFAMLLAVYLVGTALGAALYHERLARRAAGRESGQRLLGLAALACLLGTVSLWGAAAVKEGVLQVGGRSMATAIAAEAAMAIVAFFAPTVVMGALFSELCTRARQAGVPFGRALGANTLGASTAPVLFGVLLLPAVGSKVALVLVSVGYLALAAPLTWRNPTSLAVAGASAALLLYAPPLAFVDVPAGGRIVSHREGVMAAVSVVEDGNGVARLHINNRQQEGSSATLYADARQALLPLLLHPAPKRALFLGVGTGVTAGSAAEDPGLQVDAVELLPEVIEASRYFRQRQWGDAPNPRLRLVVADARRFARAAATRYDLVVSDNFHPARSGSGSLYTVEHFAAVRERLEVGGLFCQWLPLHQLDLDTLRSIVRAFLQVYPNGWALLATNSVDTPVVGLLGTADLQRLDLARIRARMEDIATPYRPAEFGVDDELALLGSFVAGPDALQRFAGQAPLNTDDHPVVAYRAPQITYAADSAPGDRLVELLNLVEIRPEELVGATGGPEWSARLAAYWQARDRYIAVGRTVQPTPDVRRMLQQVREPLLAITRISPDFRPAYEPLLTMAVALADSDAFAARALLEELAHLPPAREAVAAALLQIGDASP